MCHQNTSKLPNTAKYLHWSALHANLILFRLYSLLFSSSLLSGVGTCSVLCNKTTQSICIRHISSVRFCRVWQQPTFLQLLFSHFTEGKFCSVSLTSTMWVRRLLSTALANNTHVDKSFREFQHFASFEVSVRVKCLWLFWFLGLRQRLQHSSKAAYKFRWHSARLIQPCKIGDYIGRKSASSTSSSSSWNATFLLLGGNKFLSIEIKIARCWRTRHCQWCW